jgi:hypothetical protein
MYRRLPGDILLSGPKFRRGREEADALSQDPCMAEQDRLNERVIRYKETLS